MNNIYIYHHLGLGDHIICNAIVREYAKKYDKIFLFVKSHNYKNVSYMFRDLTNVKYISMDDSDVKKFMELNPDNNYMVIQYDTEYVLQLFKRLDAKGFDERFFEIAQLPYEDKWDKFYFERDLEKEKDAFYNKLQLKDDEEFLFVHDDPNGNRGFKAELIPKKIKTIHPIDYKNIGLFDFLYTIENAKEIHVMNSSFLNLIDCIQIKNLDLFYHEYARPEYNMTLKLNWTIYK